MPTLCLAANSSISVGWNSKLFVIRTAQCTTLGKRDGRVLPCIGYICAYDPLFSETGHTCTSLGLKAGKVLYTHWNQGQLELDMFFFLNRDNFFYVIQV